MSYSTDSLFNISLNFVVKYINLVDSFVGFPSLVAEEIFRKFVLKCDVKNKSIRDVLKKFVVAYNDMILERLNLSKSLLILNEHFESIITISRYVTELCLCGCFLGENHEIYSSMWELESLKYLCLKDNSMTNSSMRLLTLRMRMYGVGGKEIEYLNLADNHFTDGMISWLSAFPKLHYLNISGSNISQNGVQTLSSLYHLKRILNEGEHKDVINEGWASILLEKWMEEIIKKRMRKEKKLVYKKGISTTVKTTPPVFSGISLVFQKVPSLQTPRRKASPPVKKLKLAMNCGVKEIEEDIFSQYR